MTAHRVTIDVEPEVQLERDDGTIMPVRRHLSRFFAKCTCGWRGEPRRTTIVAREDGEEHLTGAEEEEAT